MDLGLEGKRVVVTGGTRGIGEAIVRQFLAEGASVAFCARDEAEVAAKTEILKNQGYSVLGDVVDVRDAGAYTAWIEKSATALGGIDIFVPNVSGGALGGEEGWQTAFEVDLMATVRGCDAVIPHIAAGADGSIVVITSIAGLEASGAPSAYNSIKSGLITYASQLGDAAGPHGIRVNCVSPGPIHVDGGFWGNVQQAQPDAYDGVVLRQPFGRLGTPEEVARCVVFLASPAASWVTRTNLIVDGGFTRRVQF